MRQAQRTVHIGKEDYQKINQENNQKSGEVFHEKEDCQKTNT